MTTRRQQRAKTHKRILDVQRLIAEGMPYAEIVAYCYDTYAIKSRAADDLISKAKEAFAEAARPQMEKMLGSMTTLLMVQYREAAEKGDTRNAVAALAKVIDLHGLAAPKKSELRISDLSPADIKAEINRLKGAADGQA